MEYSWNARGNARGMLEGAKTCSGSISRSSVARAETKRSPSVRPTGRHHRLKDATINPPPKFPSQPAWRLHSPTSWNNSTLRSDARARSTTSSQPGRRGRAGSLCPQAAAYQRLGVRCHRHCAIRHSTSGYTSSHSKIRPMQLKNFRGALVKMPCDTSSEVPMVWKP